MQTDKAHPTDIQQPFVPLVVLENALRYWWIVAVAILLGGAAGLLAHSVKPPLYESMAEFSIAVDLIGTGPLTQYEEDLGINTAGNVMVADDVLERVIDRAGQEGISISSLGSLREQISLERRFSIWNLRVRSEDPQTAQRLAEIWLETGQAALMESYQHAIQAQQLERYIQSQESCLVQAGTAPYGSGPCSASRFADIQANLRDAGHALYQEKQASRGVFPSLTIGPFNQPILSPRPVTPDRNLFVLLGGLLGLLLGIVILEAAGPRLARRAR